MSDIRKAIIAEAISWCGTPYKKNGRIKGVACNCAQLLYGVFVGSGALPADAPEPRWYTTQLATHSKEERLIDYIKAYGGVEIEEHQALPGDVVVYKTGQSHGHAAIITLWPTIVHSLPSHGVQMGLIDEGNLGKMTRRYFTLAGNR